MIRTYTINEFAVELSRKLKKAFPILKDRENDFGIYRFNAFCGINRYEEGIKVSGKFGINYSFTFKNFVLKGKINYNSPNQDNVYLTCEKNSHGYYFVSEKALLNMFGKHILTKLTNYQAIDNKRKITKQEQKMIDNFDFNHYLEVVEKQRALEYERYCNFRNSNKSPNRNNKKEKEREL